MGPARLVVQARQVLAIFARRVAADEGQALLEYALILGFVAAAAVAVLTDLGPIVRDAIQVAVDGFH